MTDREKFVDCVRRARAMGLRVSVVDFSDRWDGLAEMFPRKGKPGITYKRPSCLLYREANGSLAGYLSYIKGHLEVLVNPARQGRGIGTKLLTAAVERWEIDFQQQRYTASGAELVMKFLQRKNLLAHHGTSEPIANRR